MMRFSRLAILLAICVAVGPSPIVAQSESPLPRNPNLLDLGTLGGHWSAAYGINDSAVVVGTSFLADNVTQHAFIFKNGRMRDIGRDTDFSYASAINNKGQVAGYAKFPSQPDETHAFLYHNGVMQDIHVDLPDFYLYAPVGSYAYGINNHGDVVGAIKYSNVAVPATLWHAFLYTGGKMYDIGTWNNGNESTACGINDSGYIVGWSWAVDYHPQAVVYYNGEFQGLGTLTQNSYNSTANAINHSNRIVGWSDVDFAGDYQDAVLWSGGAIKDLGNLDINLAGSRAYGLNNHAQIVGQATDANQNQLAFLYSRGKMHSLGTLGGRASKAYSINNNGQVVGWATLPDGTNHAFVYPNQ